MDEPLSLQAEEESKERKLGFWGRLGNIFASPARTFEAIDQKPTWILPLGLLIVVSVILTQLAFPIIMNAQLENLRNNPNLTQEQIELYETQFTENVNTQRIFTVAAQVIGTPIVFLIVVGIFYLIGNVLLGGDASYKKLLAAYCWSACILILSSIVMTPLIIAKQSMSVSLSPAMLLSGDALGTRLYTLLSKFDFFTIWFLAVFAVGYGIIYRFSKAKALATVGVTWGIWIAISVVFSGIFKRFGLG
jgi:hypothetical protein